MDVTIPPAEGYGERDESQIQVIPRSMFEGVESIEPGMQFHAQSDHGVQVVTVTTVEDENITVDANHPLAGMNLHFSVSVQEIREATGEELSHGHVHGPDGHHHH